METTDNLYKVKKIIEELETLEDASEIMGACFAHVNVHWDSKFGGNGTGKSATLPKHYFNPLIRENIALRSRDLWVELQSVVNAVVDELTKVDEETADDDSTTGESDIQP